MVTDVESPPSAPPRHHHRRRWIILGAVVAVIAVAAGGFFLAWRRSGAHEVSTDEARRRFAGSSSSQPANPAVLRPTAGVYLYTGSGTEHLSLPPKSQQQGPRMPATVTHRSDGCWTFRIDFSSQHWQTWIYCPRDGGLVELGGQTFERWDFVFTKYDSTSTFKCDPPSVTIRAAMRPGDSWTQTCRGTSSGTKGVGVSSGRYTFIGEEALDVGGTKVPAYHFRQERTISGSQSGTQTAELWFAKKDGLPLRNTRNQTVKTDTVVGSSTYTERGTFTLTSLRVQT